MAGMAARGGGDARRPEEGDAVAGKGGQEVRRPEDEEGKTPQLEPERAASPSATAAPPRAAATRSHLGVKKKERDEK